MLETSHTGGMTSHLGLLMHAARWMDKLGNGPKRVASGSSVHDAPIFEALCDTRAQAASGNRYTHTQLAAPDCANEFEHKAAWMSSPEHKGFFKNATLQCEEC